MSVAAKSTDQPGGASLSFALFALALCGLYASSLYSYLLFHTLVEMFCVFVTLGVFLLAWNSRRLLDNHYFLFLAISLITSSTLQLLHTFSYKGIGIFAGYDANLPTQFWLAFRYVISFSFLAAPLFITRKLNVTATLGAFAAVTALLVVAVFSGVFPDCYLEGKGLTGFKIYSEYVIIAILLSAAALLAGKRDHFDPRVLRPSLFSILAAAAADGAFTRYVSVYGPANLVGHLFLFLSAVLIYRAIVSTALNEPAAILFRNLEQSQQALQQSEARLQLALKERLRELVEKEALNEKLQRESTVRKNTEESLRASEEQFSRAIQDAPIPVVLHTEDGEVLEVSRSWVELTGYPRLDLPSFDFWLSEHVCAETGNEVRTQMRELFQGQRRSFAAEFPVVTRDGRSRHWSFSASSPGALHDGRRFAVCMAVDITERKEGEAALQRSNQRLDLLATTANCLLASDAPQQLVDALCRDVMTYLGCDAFFNYLVDEEAGDLELNACAGIGPEEAARIKRLAYGVAVCGCAARDACRIVAEDIPGSPDPRTELVKSLGIKAYACHPLLSQGRVMGTLSFGTRTRSSFSEDDLSLMKAVADQVAIAMERKLMEEQLRQATQAAEAASRTKSQFLANMSHELRTPMTGVLGMLDLALQTPDSPQRSDCLQAARKSGRSLLRILNDILDLAKVEAGKFLLDEKPFRVRSCLEETVDILVPEARRKGIELVLEVAEDLPDHALGDQVRFRQVLTNLIGNAVKFTDRGRVQVKIGTGEEPAGGGFLLRCSVSDTGIGIPADKAHLLFNSFSQVDDSNTRSFGGTGLGLAICKEIVTRMGGSIGFESEVGRGSVFSFTVRLGVSEEGCEERCEERAAVAPAQTLDESADKAARANKRLLVAEDDATIRQVLGGMLARFQYQVDFAEDGRKAVEMWRQSSYDMILMDVQMPGLDGFHATRVVREEELVRGGRIPILAMTAHAMKEDEQRCIDAGMDGYMSKPIDFKECLDKIKTLLS